MRRTWIYFMPDEETVAKTKFGTITNKRLIYQNGMNFFSKGYSRTASFDKITSVDINIKRRIGIGLLLILLGLPLFLFIVGIFMVLAGFFYIIEYPVVTIGLKDEEDCIMTGTPFCKTDAKRFVESLQEALLMNSRDKMN